jgi:hypothetical protein
MLSNSLKAKGLRLFTQGFTQCFTQWLYSKPALLLKTYDNKAPPTPPLAQHHHKTVENQALHDAN